MRDRMQEKLKELRGQRERLIAGFEQLQADLNATAGAIQVLEGLLAEAPEMSLLEKPQAEEA